MQIGVPQSCVEPTFVFQFTCARQRSLPLLAAAWLECMPCLRRCKNFGSEISSFSASQSLAPGCAGRTAMHRDCHSGLDRDLCGVPRNFRGALDGNRRKQTETDRKQAESRGIRFGASLVVVSWPSCQLRRVVLGKNRPKIKKNKRLLCTALCLNLRGVGDEKQPSS